MNILVTGGVGFIGTHTLLALNKSGYNPIVIDNLSNSKIGALQRTEKIAGNIKFPFYETDICDGAALGQIFSQHSIDAVIHFAGLKAVGESAKKPLKYYQNNLGSTLTLLGVMDQYNCRQLIFSSSATVYGAPRFLPLTENHPLSATNPYGRTKLMIEQVLTDFADANSGWKIALLRYFNPVGAHPSGLIGEDPLGPPNNLFPCVSQFVKGISNELNVFGVDYPTHDGSGVRDYLHVCDLADGHVAALKILDRLEGAVPINLGTGRGYSVLEVIRQFEEIVGHEIPYRVLPRRPGDVAECYADVAKAQKILKWGAEHELRKMIVDSVNWQNKGEI